MSKGCTQVVLTSGEVQNGNLICTFSVHPKQFFKLNMLNLFISKCFTKHDIYTMFINQNFIIKSILNHTNVWLINRLSGVNNNQGCANVFPRPDKQFISHLVPRNLIET